MNIAEIKKNITPICERERVKKAILFGSYATGHQSDRSDVDLIFIKDTSERFLDRLHDDLYREVFKAMDNHAVDLLIYNPKEFMTISHRKFFQRVLREGVTLYESE
jgi:predicted nucleotidyltransferase